MKRLINLILPAVMLLSLTSCSKYYINTLSSMNMVKDEQTGEFLLENDSVKISYGFAGEDAPVNIKVYNKLPIPIFVDWTRSSIIAKGKAKGFVPDEVKFSGNISTTAWNDKPLTSAESFFNGTVNNPKQVTFIPPNSSVESIVRSFDPNVFTEFSDSVFKESEVLPTFQGQVRVKVGNFDYLNSPLSFRSYLTLYTQDGLKNNVFSYDREFYVSKSVKTSARPQDLLQYGSSPANIFYSSKPTGYGKTMTGVGAVAIVAGAAALAPDESQK